MSGLECTEIMLSKINIDNLDFRIDSEYFLKYYLSLEAKLDKININKISDFAYVTDGIHTSIIFDDNSNINLLSAKSPKNNIFDLSGNKCISKNQHIENPRTRLQKMILLFLQLVLSEMLLLLMKVYCQQIVIGMLVLLELKIVTIYLIMCPQY